ncbi:MAG: ribbon-helix-helix protein, CopG family [Acidimicrobiales bacterium]
MARPTSFRLSEDLRSRLEDEASRRGASVTAVVASMLDEGLKTRRFPGIVYRDGPTGRRAGVLGGPDVWEIVRAVRDTPGNGEERIRSLAHQVDLPISRVRSALDFYGAFPTEIDLRIEADELAMDRVRHLTDRRDRLIKG